MEATDIVANILSICLPTNSRPSRATGCRKDTCGRIVCPSRLRWPSRSAASTNCCSWSCRASAPISAYSFSLSKSRWHWISQVDSDHGKLSGSSPVQSWWLGSHEKSLLTNELHVYLSIYLPIYLPVCLSIYLSFFLSVFLFRLFVIWSEGCHAKSGNVISSVRNPNVCRVFCSHGDLLGRL